MILIIYISPTTYIEHNLFLRGENYFIFRKSYTEQNRTDNLFLIQSPEPRSTWHITIVIAKERHTNE